MVTLRAAAVGCGLPRSQAHHAGFHASVCVTEQSSTKAAGFIVGMGSNTHQSKHGEIVSDVQSFAEIVQPVAR
jgi:hypothetical protein